MKKIIALIIAATLTLSFCFTAFGGSGSWMQGASGWWYQNPDGSYPTGTWQAIDGSWYHFNNSGYMQTGWLYDGGYWYYLGTSGEMQTGWKLINGDWYYFEDSGIMMTGWAASADSWYYFNDSGIMLTGNQNIDGINYSFDDSGKLLPESEQDDFSIVPYDVEYLGDMLLVWSTITNYNDYSIYNIKISDFSISNIDGLIASENFGILDSLSMGPYESIDYVFIFTSDSVYRPYADLSNYIYQYYYEYNF